MQNNVTIKINIKGGVLSPGDLHFIVESAKEFGVKHVYLGERQSIYLVAHGRTKEALVTVFSSKNYDFEIGEDAFPNIISSYPAEDLFSNNTWLSEGVYQDVLNSFTFRPTLKISIVDSTQGLVPLFTGNLNFIASSNLNFWFLFIKHPSYKGMYRWPVLIYSTDIGRLSSVLETKLNNSGKKPTADLEKLAQEIHTNHKFIVTDIANELPLMKIKFPNYEGLNRIGDRHWMGIYRRDNTFPTEFLEALCKLCSETKMGKLYLTPWKSIIIKGISDQDKHNWEKLLGTHGINMRHSSLELNWQIPDFDKSTLKLKRYLVNAFDKADIQTHGLGFTIKTCPLDVAGSIVIEKRSRLNILGKIKLFPIYTILYAEDFNPNAQKLQVYAVDIEKRDLAYNLMHLCRKYYEQLEKEEKTISVKKEVKVFNKTQEVIYQCQDCLTMYLEKYGDIVNNIPPNTPFEKLPSDYCCPVCESPVSSYRLKQIAEVAA